MPTLHHQMFHISLVLRCFRKCAKMRTFESERVKAPYFEERGVSAVSTERIKEWKRSELGEKENSSRETSYLG